MKLWKSRNTMMDGSLMDSTSRSAMMGSFVPFLPSVAASMDAR